MTTTDTASRSMRTVAAYVAARDTLGDLDEAAAYEALDTHPQSLDRYAYPWPDETVALGRVDGTWAVRVEIADPTTGHLEGWVVLRRGDVRPRVIDADDIRRYDVGGPIAQAIAAQRLSRTESFRGLPLVAVLAMCAEVAAR